MPLAPSARNGVGLGSPAVEQEVPERPVGLRVPEQVRRRQQVLLDMDGAGEGLAANGRRPAVPANPHPARPASRLAEPVDVVGRVRGVELAAVEVDAGAVGGRREVRGVPVVVRARRLRFASRPACGRGCERDVVDPRPRHGDLDLQLVGHRPARRPLPEPATPRRARARVARLGTPQPRHPRRPLVALRGDLAATRALVLARARVLGEVRVDAVRPHLVVLAGGLDLDQQVPVVLPRPRAVVDEAVAAALLAADQGGQQSLVQLDVALALLVVAEQVEADGANLGRGLPVDDDGP